MKVYRIIDEYKGDLELGFLFYYEKHKEFSIEIAPKVSEEDAPIFLSSFISRSRLTIAPEWSARWVQSRIIPPDRQNLGMILKENRMVEYDPCRLLELSEGRCAQDDCAVVPLKTRDYPQWLTERLKKRIDYLLPITPTDFVIIWHDGQIRRTAIDRSLASDMYPDGDGMMDRLEHAVTKPAIMESISKLSGGTGITWGSGIYVTSDVLYENGTLFPVEVTVFEKMIEGYAMSTSEVCRELSISRQYINRLTASHTLSLLKDDGKVRLYSRSDVDRLDR